MPEGTPLHNKQSNTTKESLENFYRDLAFHVMQQIASSLKDTAYKAIEKSLWATTGQF